MGAASFPTTASGSGARGHSYPSVTSIMLPASNFGKRFGGSADQVGPRVLGEQHRWPRRPGEVEVVDQVAERAQVLAHVGPRVRPAVVERVEPLAVQEPVLDE